MAQGGEAAPAGRMQQLLQAVRDAMMAFKERPSTFEWTADMIPSYFKAAMQQALRK